MNDSIHVLWVAPLGTLLILWLAFFILGAKELILDRRPRTERKLPSEEVEQLLLEMGLVDPVTGKRVPQPRPPIVFIVLVMLVTWPLFLLQGMEDWTSRKNP